MLYATSNLVVTHLEATAQPTWMVCTSHESSLHPWRHDAMEQAVTAVKQAHQVRVNAAPLAAAADGSWSRYSHRGGLGVVFADGQWVAKSVPRSSSPLLSELFAVATALTRTDGSPLLLMTDSQSVLNAVKEAPVTLSNAEFTAVKRIRELLKASPRTQLRKVKSHSGVALHDGADSLAVAARRHKEAPLFDEKMRSEVYERIVNEALTLHRTAAA